MNPAEVQERLRAYESHLRTLSLERQRLQERFEQITEESITVENEHQALLCQHISSLLGRSIEKIWCTSKEE